VAADADEQLVAKRFSQTIERSAHCGLTQETALSRPRDVSFLQQHEKSAEEVEVSSSYML
jgi:hypothetical protein